MQVFHGAVQVSKETLKQFTIKNYTKRLTEVTDPKAIAFLKSELHRLGKG